MKNKSNRRDVGVMSLDREDGPVLDRLQSDFPLVSRPFDELGEELGMDGREVLERVRSMEEEGYIRRVAPILSSREVGFGASALVAVRVDGGSLEEVTDFLEGLGGVTHCYERDAPRYDLWFTLHARDEEELDDKLKEVRESTPADEVLPLPAERVFGLGVKFDLGGDGG